MLLSLPSTSPTLTIRRLPPLPRSFYTRDPRAVARDLLGKLLIRRDRRLILAGRIVETEAYLGAIDPGAHAYRGQTPRNAVLFGPPGHAYVYFIYGTHFCTNISCHPPGDPGSDSVSNSACDAESNEGSNEGCHAGGVLLRALEPVCGLETMSTLRGLPFTSNPRPSQLRLLTSGPGRLSQALDITRDRDNAKDLCSPASDLYVADDGTPAPPISATPRINVTRAPLDEWRFVITGNPFPSGKKVP